MRHRRALYAFMSVVSLSACTALPDRSTHRLPVNPTPTKPGQVVVIAGNGDYKGGPVDGVYAVRTAVSPIGGIASAPDGSLYFPVSVNGTGRLARLTPDGRIHLMGQANEGDQLTVYKNDLWQVSTASSSLGFSLTINKISLKDGSTSRYFTLDNGTSKSITVTDESKKKLPMSHAADPNKYWRGSIAGLRADGTPIIVNEQGDIFEILDANTLRLWRPTNYMTARQRVAKPDTHNAGTRLNPTYIMIRNNGETEIFADPGIIIIDQENKAQGIQFRSPADQARTYFHATEASPSGNSEIIAVDSNAGASYDNAIAKITDDGAVYPLRSSEPDCDDMKTLNEISSSHPSGIARRTNGTLTVPSYRCRKIFAFIW